MDSDWQNECHEIKERGAHLLQTEKWSDCRFLVGTTPNQRIISGHKLILAMASPVFERMFYGNLIDKSDPIIIPDVQPEAFQSMMEYIYSDRINIASFDKACELCYVAKKYMLPHVVERCTQYLWSDLSPKNACRAYEFAKLFEETGLMKKSMELIAAYTRNVLKDPSFLDIEMSTLMDILDQDRLAIDSELDLFNALVRYSNGRSSPRKETTPLFSTVSSAEPVSAGPDQNSVSNNDEGNAVVEIKMEPDINAIMNGQEEDDTADENAEPLSERSETPDVIIVEDTYTNGRAVGDTINSSPQDILYDRPSTSSAAANNSYFNDIPRPPIDDNMVRQAVKKIRFLTLTPQQFAEGPARSDLLQQHEALAILIKISSPSINDCPMPEGFCSSRTRRNHMANNLQHAAPEKGNSCIYSRLNSPPPVPMINNGFLSFSNHGSGWTSGSGPAVTNDINPDQDVTASDTRRCYCIRTLNQQFDFHNTNVSDCGITFQVDSNVWITGVQVPTQVLCGELMNALNYSERYTEILYAHIQDMHGSRLSYTHCTSRVRYDSLLELSFDRPIFIYKSQIYKIFVTFNKSGWYPMYTCVSELVCNRVRFKFNVGDPNESVRDGLIRGIVFYTPQENSRGIME